MCSEGWITDSVGEVVLWPNAGVAQDGRPRQSGAQKEVNGDEKVEEPERPRCPVGRPVDSEITERMKDLG